MKEIPWEELKTGELIGNGSSGSVTKVTSCTYSGTPTHSLLLNQVNWKGKTVAVKNFRVVGLSKEDLKDFTREVIIARYSLVCPSSYSHYVYSLSYSKLSHPNIPIFEGVCTKLPNLCLVMEYFPEGDLYRLVRM